MLLSSCFFLLLDTAGTKSALADADFTFKAVWAASVLAFEVGTCSTTKTSCTTAAARPMLSLRHGGKRTGGQHYTYHSANMLENRDVHYSFTPSLDKDLEKLTILVKTSWFSSQSF